MGMSTPSQVSSTGCSGFFDHIVAAPPNAIFHTKAMYKKDPNPNKINLGIGAYRTDEGKPWVLPSVRAAEQIIAADHSLDHEYLGQGGDAEYCGLARGLLFGETSPAVQAKRVATVQTLSGTGGLRVGLDFMKMFHPNACVFVSGPTWGNHKTVCRAAGFATKTYRYWDPVNRKLDFAGMIADLKTARFGDIVLLHTCAHNPTGVDPTQAQWREICEVVKARKLICFFDTAYQGFASGDLAKDAYALRYFVDQGVELVASQSFAKNFGLYNERIGAFHVCAGSEKAAKAAESHLKLIIRWMYSNPPVHGARIVKTVLKSPKLKAMWFGEIKSMSSRINKCRHLLYNELQRLNTPGTWEHVITQIGMFTFTGLNKNQAQSMINDHHVYMLKSGRISMAGVTTKNVAYLAKAMDTVVRTVQ